MNKLYYPSNLDLAAFDLFRVEYRYKLLFFISTIHFARVTNKGLYKSDNDYVRVNSNIIGRFIRKNDVKRVKDDLFKMGIIETDNVRIYKKKSFGFRFTEQYRGQKVTTMKNPYPKQASSPELTKQTHAYLFKNLQTVTIEPAAYDFINDSYREDVKKYNCNLISSDFIAEKEWFFSTDKNTGRVFNNITNLGRDLRKFLRLDGQPVFEVDVANCQPLLLHSVYENKETAEAKRYLRLVESGKFYELLQTLTGEEDRSKIKKQFLTFLFSKERDLAKWALSIENEFAQQFPELTAIISAMRKRDKDALWKKLQTLEASIIIGKVVPKCEALGLKVLTIHDSLLTHEEDKKTVKSLIKKEFAAELGVKVSVKTKDDKSCVNVISEEEESHRAA
ncbi:MAG: hypothetical protein WCH57_06180 [Verrucomicrobiota bacterium]